MGKIRILITGGTIDAEKITRDKYLFEKTHLPQMLKQGRLTVPVILKVLMLKHSLEIGDEDRRLILQEIENSKEDKIIITHGTSTMVTTTKFLGNKTKKKTVVLTGAIIPFNKPGSDSLFNLGSAIIAVQILPPSVYIVMNGKIFKWNNVNKNIKKMIFETEN